jgi:flagellar hook assembly protein FlgD
LRYRAPQATPATLSIHDASGRLVRTLHRGPLAAGLVIWEWDRRDDYGRTVDGGVYFATLATAQLNQTLRLIALR